MICDQCEQTIHTEATVLNIFGEKIFFCSEDCFYCYVEDRKTEIDIEDN